MKKGFVLFGLIVLLFSVYISFADFPDVPDVGPAHCVDTPEMPCGGETNTPADTLPTSGTYEELWATWEKYCRWGTVGITQAQCNQLQNAIDRAYESENTPAETLAETSETTEEAETSTPTEPAEIGTDWYAQIDAVMQDVPESQLEKANIIYHDYENAISNLFAEGMGQKEREEKQKQLSLKAIADLSALKSETTGSEEQNMLKTSLEDSAALMDSVAGKHNKEISSIQNYYARPEENFPGMSPDEDGAKAKFEAAKPFGTEVVNAKNAYQDALKEGVSGENLAKLKSAYDDKTTELKRKLFNEVLTYDSGNADALWELGVLSKWQGDNKQAYEYYRDALLAEKSRNPFRYQERLDSINNPAMRMELLQSMAPNENIITLPTTETSPFLKALDDGLKTLTQPVNEKMRQAAKEIEKMSRSISLSDWMTKKLGKLNGLNAKEE